MLKGLRGNVCLCVCKFTYIRIYIDIGYIDVYTCMLRGFRGNVCLCVCMYTYIRVYTCIYAISIYMYICSIYMHVYRGCIYRCINLLVERPSW